MTLGLSKKQADIFKFAQSDYTALIADGAIRSGKTTWLTIAFVDDAMRRYSGKLFGICGKTVDSAVKNIIQPFISSGVATKVMNCELRWSSSQKVLTLQRGQTVNYFEVFGGKDESSYTLIQGRTFAGVLLDEVALMPKSFVEQALSRCSVEGSKYWFNCNPEGQMHWFNQEWILQAERRNALHLHFTLEDNPSLSEEIKERYRNTFSGVFYQRDIQGLWVSAEGVIYDMFDADIHVLQDVPETEGEYFVSSDFGIQNATVFLLWRKIKDTENWVCLKEWYYSGRDSKKQKTVTELVQGLHEMLDGAEPRRVIVDPSAASLIVELKKYGYYTQAAKNDVINGIADVGAMLRKKRLFFMADCKNTIAEFGSYVWDEKASASGIDRPIKENDHAMDAVRYFVNTRKLQRHDGAEEEYYTLGL